MPALTAGTEVVPVVQLLPSSTRQARNTAPMAHLEVATDSAAGVVIAFAITVTIVCGEAVQRQEG